MLGLVVVRGRVLVRRRVAAADVATGKAAAELHPGAARLQALFAAGRGLRRRIAGLLDVLTSHGRTLTRDPPDREGVQTRRTSFPTTSSLSIRRCACAASARGKVAARTGRSSPLWRRG